ncbi:MAG TPA: nucleoside diphosphate kinase regulator, partial [Chryseobacterium sp.]|nr:nucleoside diphosphate kinase regulator [Chryseobacterium sp.]
MKNSDGFFIIKPNIMKQILITKQDYTRIHQAITNAKQSNSIKKDEAEKLLAELHSAKIVKSEEIPADVVTMNSIVKFHFENNKKEMQFQIVYPNQADFRNGKVSIFSPVAAALIGYGVNDEIEWIVPSGVTKIIIDE